MGISGLFATQSVAPSRAGNMSATTNPINRKRFFDCVRRNPFGGRLGPKQVEGMCLLLDTQETLFPALCDDDLAYCLATAYHETGATMQPVLERGGPAYFTRMYDITGNRPRVARELGNLTPGDGAKYPGMGYVQSTGRANARRARAVIREVLGEDIDFETSPKRLMEPKYAAALLFYGAIAGVWTGKKLSDYIGPGKRDFVAARRVVNRTDKATLIAGYAEAFLAALTQSRHPDSPAAMRVVADNALSERIDKLTTKET